MKTMDRVLQRWRIGKARPFIAAGSRVLDIGSADGALFQHVRNLDDRSLGIDPSLTAAVRVSGHTLLPGFFPQDMPAVAPFDVITMLAVLEHFPASEYSNLKRGCVRFLKPGGLLILTVPSPQVDRILAWLKFLRLIDGMSLEEHHGFDIGQTTVIFSGENFKLLRHRPFQLGLNHLFVFEHIPESSVTCG
jgi:2-polyprenyl-3-methyl-5-hydroxy-6-metoxy-1,4-benzoquinol methylase